MAIRCATRCWHSSLMLCLSCAGTLPSSFGNLSALTVIDLSTARLSGDFSSLRLSQSLAHFHVYSNEFSGTLVKQLFSAKSLFSVLLGDNQLSGTIFGVTPRRSAAVGVGYFAAGTNFFSGNLGSGLCSFHNLKGFNFNANQLSGSTPEW